MVADIEGFFTKVGNGNIEIYNEFSFQHELGLYLREIFPTYKVQFERNVRCLICIMNSSRRKLTYRFFSDAHSILAGALELKFPRNGQYPEQMYSFCKDIVFLEQLVERGFEKAYFVAVVDDPLFYSGSKATGIYAHFRSNHPIGGKIQKPTGRKYEEINVLGKYQVNWIPIQNHWKYFIVEVNQSLVRIS